MSKEKNLLLKEIMKFGILRLTLNDPKSKNALSKKMIFEMMK